MNVRIGISPDSWGVWSPDDPKQVPWRQFLDEAILAGYEGVELGPIGYLPTSPSILGPELKKRGLQVCATYVMGHLEKLSAWPDLERQVLGVGGLLAALGARFLVLIDGTYTDLCTGKSVAPEDLNESEWKRLIETTHKVADIAWDRFKLTVVFHPHVDTHVQYEDQVEALLEQTDASRIKLCVDTGHHAYRGGDPASFIARHQRRIPYIHLKSVDQQVKKEVEERKIPLAVAISMGVFCEPAQGIVNFPQLREVLRQINYDGWAIVEQDMYPAPPDKPLPIARRTRTYLREIGIG